MKQMEPKLATTYFENGYKTSIYTGFDEPAKKIHLGSVLCLIDSLVTTGINK